MEGAGPSSLMELAEDELIDELYLGYVKLKSPFCVGGSLGRIPVRLAVAAAGDGSSAAQMIELPAGGQDALDALLEACEPAVFGKGKETGGSRGQRVAEVRTVGKRWRGEERAECLPNFRLLPHPPANPATALSLPSNPWCGLAPQCALVPHTLQCGTTRTAPPWP